MEEVKKLINNKEIKYIYSLDTTSNDTVNNLVKQNGVELITLNDMYSVDGGITNTNDNYLSVMKNNISLIEKELYK